MKLLFALDKLSSLLVCLRLSLRLSLTVCAYVHAKSCTRVYFKYSLHVLLQANLHIKLDQGMLFTREIFASKCDVTSEWYRSYISIRMHIHTYVAMYGTVQMQRPTPVQGLARVFEHEYSHLWTHSLDSFQVSTRNPSQVPTLEHLLASICILPLH